MILLSTDEEINKKYHKYMAPYLSRSYKIEYDEKLNGSKIEEGYLMEVKLDTVRTTAGVKNTLSRLKQLTGIETWNVLCCWAFCLSIKQENLPREIEETLDGVK